MLTIENLKQFGADVDTGLARCVNREDLYFRLIKMVPTNSGFFSIKEDIASKNYEGAFQAAHSLKGICANLSLDPLTKVISELTELLRNPKDMDYSTYLEEMELQRSRLEELCKD